MAKNIFLSLLVIFGVAVSFASFGQEVRLTPEQLELNNFDTMIRLRKNVVVVIGATWCPVCQGLSKKLDHMSPQIKGQGYEVVKLDYDESPALLDRYAIKSVPRTLVFKDGAPLTQFNGNPPDNQILEKLK